MDDHTRKMNYVKVIHELLEKGGSHNHVTFRVFNHVKFLLEESKIKEDLEFIETHLFLNSCRHNHYLFEYFISLGANVNLENRFGLTALDISIGTKDRNTFEILIRNLVTPTPESLLFFLDTYTYIDIDLKQKFIERIKSENISLDEPINDVPPLFHAIRLRVKCICVFLLKNGANPNIFHKGNNPCSIAIQEGDSDILVSLLEYGASLTYHNDNPTHEPCLLKEAIKSKDPETFLKILIENGIDLNHTHKEGKSFMNFAIKRASRSTFEFLLEKGLNPKLDNEGRNNHLVYCMRKGFKAHFKSLIKHGADINSVYICREISSKGKTSIPYEFFYNGCDILQISSSEHSKNWVQILIDNGVNITKKHIDHLIVTSSAYNDPYPQKNYFLVTSEKKRRDQLILMDILLARTFQEDSHFSKYSLHLPILKMILKLADVPFVFPPRKSERELLKRFKIEHMDQNSEGEDSQDSFWD